MADKASIEELQAILRPLREYVGRKLLHEKSGGYYYVTGFQFRESTMQVEFTYRTCHRESVSFSRPLAELFDGRFRFK